MNGKKRIAALLVFLTALLLFALAEAADAPDITQECEFRLCSTNRRAASMTDRQYTTYWESNKIRNPWVSITSDTPIHGLYLCFRKMPSSYEIQTLVGEEEPEWVTVCEGDVRFQHAFYALGGLKKVRIRCTQQNSFQMGFNEIFVFGEGDVPDWVQRWEPTEEKADLMILIAHPDDELLFTGGAIPTYDVERNKRVIVAYLSWSNTTRRSEALNGLWTLGVRHYPVFGGFVDRFSNKTRDAYEKLGKTKVLSWVTSLFRQYRPEVVVTHDLEGEYGHGQHRMLADACIQCYEAAADPGKYPDSAEAWGPWQVKKLYLHLYGNEEEQTRFDWNVPLASMGGKTGLELASEAYAMHVSQEKAKVKINHKWTTLSVEITGEAFSNTSFGLYSSEVGPDETHLDFFEPIESSGQDDEETDGGSENT